MRKTFTTAAMAALIALPLLAGASAASASCQSRKNTGTLIGGVGGALLGNSISHGGGGAIIGGLGGAVVGHQIAKSGCSGTHAYYRRGHTRYAHNSTYRPASNVYYDQRGNPVQVTR
ncbi:MAG: glycine zipper 2TM domain-containing protein [Phenylobacterium sp.]|nr:MAG: glycine zipper 2TM domain-containing protein [Phenylobacterium sp.]